MKQHGITTDYRTLLFSAHQMGTCKMGIDPTQSVVNEYGETWGCANIFICDASVFPTSSGVNPMLTVLAIADGIADSVVDRVRKIQTKSKHRGRHSKL
jgi:long-chain-alcohol oxidase